MGKYYLTKGDERDFFFCRTIRYDLNYGPYDPINKVVNFSKTTDWIYISYEMNIKCDLIDNFAQQVFRFYSIGFKDYKKELAVEYFDITGEIVNKYQIKDKYDNEINILPVNGIIFFDIMGENKPEEYDFFDEIVVNACHYTVSCGDDNDEVN